MSKHVPKKPTSPRLVGPVRSGSPLYRLLELTARRVVDRLRKTSVER